MIVDVLSKQQIPRLQVIVRYAINYSPLGMTEEQQDDRESRINKK